MAGNPFPPVERLERSLSRPARERLSTNENEFGPAPEVVRAIRDAAVEAHRYPDSDHHELRCGIGKRLSVRTAAVAVGAGIDGLLNSVCRSFLAPGAVAVATEGTYPTFAYFARSRGAVVRTVPYRDACTDWEALADTATRADADVVYLAEPDNPTGGSLGAGRVLALADALPERTVLVVDGAYAEYQAPYDRLRVADVLARRMLWLRTFSKAHALAGMRIGYVVGDPALVGSLANGGEHYAVGRLAQAAALAALGADSRLAEVVRLTGEGRADYAKRFTERGFEVLPSSTNFVTVRCADPVRAEGVADSLRDAGIFVRRLAVPGMTDCLRITVGPARQRDAVLFAVDGLLTNF